MKWVNVFVQKPNQDDYWVKIPAGEFEMGHSEGDDDEKPVHSVYLNTYKIGRYEVTNGQYGKCVQDKVCLPSGSAIAGYEDHPVVNVTWQEAQTFCEWLGGRLPTEAEWEKAARGGLEGRLYPWGNDEVICDLGEENGVQFGYCDGDTIPVGSFGGNGYGLYDMAGNAWEWVADWYDENYYEYSSHENPMGPETGKYRVIRGGAWNYTVYGLRVAYRSVSYPDSRANFIGFRCASSVDEK
jgi:formylglycine-generating enzyme required for sulfatase activity